MLAVWAEPVPLWHCKQWRAEAGEMPAVVAQIAQQDGLRVIFVAAFLTTCVIALNTQHDNEVTNCLQ